MKIKLQRGSDVHFRMTDFSRNDKGDIELYVMSIGSGNADVEMYISPKDAEMIKDVIEKELKI